MSTQVCLALTVGVALSVAIESLLVPRPTFRRAWWAWSLHVGCWLLGFSLLVVATGRPWCAVAGVSAVLLLIVMVSNVKSRTLREPFVFRDFEYFVDMLAHPRLFIPFMGWAKVALATLAFAGAVATALWIEAPPADASASGSLLHAALGAGTGSLVLLCLGMLGRAPMSFDPVLDVARHGVLGAAWCYAWAERDAIPSRAPFAVSVRRPAQAPHLVAVQSESFFDVRESFAGVRNAVLAEYDLLSSEALTHGPLEVPAWGANTSRTEFAFLTGLANAALGAHRFKPTRLALRQEFASLASALRSQGYCTICVHPYPAGFYARHRTFPNLGFEQFLDIEAFAGAERAGPYISDAAVAEKTIELLADAPQPLFVYVITMENHGPLHLESVDRDDVTALYERPPPPGCDELTVYLRHLRNADRMAGRLHQFLDAMDHPASLCWFGDHVPIMSSVYEAFGVPAGHTHYLVWSNQLEARSCTERLGVEVLARRWLREIGFEYEV